VPFFVPVDLFHNLRGIAFIKYYFILNKCHNGTFLPLAWFSLYIPKIKKEVEMKRVLSLLILAFGFAFLSSCSSTGTMTGGSDVYGYYDNMYYHGNPNYYANPYLYQRPIIRNNVIVVPEQRKEVRRTRENVRRREVVSPDSRRTVSPAERQINRTEAPARRGTTVSPPSRNSSTPAPATRRAPSNNRSRSGNN